CFTERIERLVEPPVVAVAHPVRNTTRWGWNGRLRCLGVSIALSSDGSPLGFTVAGDGCRLDTLREVEWTIHRLRACARCWWPSPAERLDRGRSSASRRLPVRRSIPCLDSR